MVEIANHCTSIELVEPAAELTCPQRRNVYAFHGSSSLYSTSLQTEMLFANIDCLIVEFRRDADMSSAGLGQKVFMILSFGHVMEATLSS